MTPPRTASYIRGLLPSLGATEARVATALLSDPRAAAGWSVADVAAASATSPATVVRACQRFGFSGWGQLREELVRELADPEPAGDGAGRGGVAEIVGRTLRGGLSQIESAAAMLDPVEVERAVEALVDAGRIVTATSSDLAHLGQYAAFRFATIGRGVEAPPDPITQHVVAGTLRRGDVLLAVGHSGTNALTLRVAQAAGAAGATVIAVTGFARGPLADAADVHLCVGVAEPETQTLEFTRIRVAQMLAIDALQTAVGVRTDHAAAADATDRSLREYVHRRAHRG